ncbi:hydrolase [Escherichia coli]|uniref:Hydrolase n=1 Tax=Escherichia coli TaxID=562 RepID=A0A376L2D9_ECOLX|nr:hydrolase [Escherichia coli]
MTIADAVPHYDLVITDNNTDVFVLVIGESARTDNMSIYGYSAPNHTRASETEITTETVHSGNQRGHLIPPLRYRWHYL